ncbi:MAG: TonB-dependent receptor [Gemmatimonadales bacterium]
MPAGEGASADEIRAEEVTMVTIHQRPFTRRVPFTLPAVFIAAAIFSGELASQPGGTVIGTVLSADKSPVSQARVTVAGTHLATVSRADGGFEITRVPTGRQRLQVAMIGYSPAARVIEIAAGATLQVSLVLEPFELEPVRVTADPNFFAGMTGFEERRARGSGWYFNREEIKAMQARQVTDVLRRVPGMQIETVVGGLSGGSPTARTGRNISGAGSPCVMTYYVNGSPFPLSGDISINHFIAADDVAAIEVYTGSAQIPPEFNSSLHGSRCGVVAIWMRSSLDANEAR